MHTALEMGTVRLETMSDSPPTAGQFQPARTLLEYVQLPGGEPERLQELLLAVQQMVEALPEDTDADPDSDDEAPQQEPRGVLTLLVTNQPYLELDAAQQLSLVLIDLVETLWYLDHVSEQEAVWYCRFGYGCHWGLRLGMVIESLETQSA